jgi:hypothetical protein
MRKSCKRIFYLKKLDVQFLKNRQQVFTVTPFRLCSKRKRERETKDTGFKEIIAMWVLKNKFHFIIYLELKHVRKGKVADRIICSV